MRFTFAGGCLLFLALLSRLPGVDLGPTKGWDGFSGSSEHATIEARDATIDRPKSRPGGEPTVTVDFHVSANPALILRLRETKDFSGCTALAVDLHNPESFEIRLYARIDQKAQPGQTGASFSSLVLIPAESKTTLVLPFTLPPAMALGMHDPARLPGATIAKFSGAQPLDPAQIDVLQVYLDHPKQRQRLEFSRARLLQTDLVPLLYSNICDTYGQFTKETWPGKVMTDADIVGSAEADARLASIPSLEPDAFGGKPGAATVEASGFFKTHRDAKGTWWLVTPTGHLFYSIGVDSLQFKSRSTYIEGREWMFTGLPAPDSPLAAHYGTADNRANTPGRQARGYDHGRQFNFYTANLQRKHGPDFATRWPGVTLDRLRAWGFNTIGNWSDEGLISSTDSHGRRMPYVCSLWYGGEVARVGTAHDWWGPLVDPFDPRFAEAVEANLRPALLARRADPYLIGYFVDNELSWASGRNSAKDREHFSLLYGVLRQGADSPAKHTWVEQLRAHYITIAALNKEWGTAFGRWENLLQDPYPVPDTLPFPAMRSDFSAFLKAYARQYFQVIADVIHRYDGNHLYLGCRFSGFAEETVEACAEVCDVVSFNIYAPEVLRSEWSFLNRVDKPALIGEFHMGATDRGGFGPGLIPVANQAERASSYSTYLKSVLTNPNFIGAHWFSYVDEPLTGRMFDGENYAFGLVTVADQPYPELVEAASRINREAYAIRAGIQELPPSK